MYCGCVGRMMGQDRTRVSIDHHSAGYLHFCRVTWWRWGEDGIFRAHAAFLLFIIRTKQNITLTFTRWCVNIFSSLPHAVACLHVWFLVLYKYTDCQPNCNNFSVFTVIKSELIWRQQNYRFEDVMPAPGCGLRAQHWALCQDMDMIITMYECNPKGHSGGLIQFAFRDKSCSTPRDGRANWFLPSESINKLIMHSHSPRVTVK